MVAIKITTICYRCWFCNNRFGLFILSLKRFSENRSIVYIAAIYGSAVNNSQDRQIDFGKIRSSKTTLYRWFPDFKRDLATTEEA